MGVLQLLFPSGFSFISNLSRSCVLALAYACYDRSSFAYTVLGGCTAAMAVVVTYRIKTVVPRPPKSTPVPAGKIRICVAGYTHSSPTSKARYMAQTIAKKFGDRYETWFYFDTFGFFPFTAKRFANVDFPTHLKGHATSPFVWLEEGADNKVTPIGGSDHFQQWVAENPALIGDKDVKAVSERPYRIVHYITGRGYHNDNGMGEPMTARVE